MAVRRLSKRGIALQVEVPDDLVRRLRPWQRRRPPVYSVATRIEPVPRDKQHALDYLRNPNLAGDGTKPNPVAQDTIAEQRAKQEAATTLQERVDAVSWYHTIELPGGITTPGAHDHVDIVSRFDLPADLTGQRVLDVATFDGFWAFELERRGADVTAIDVPDVASFDWPTGVRDIIVNEELNLAFGDSFRIAHEARGSSVTRVECSVYDLDPDSVGTFDLVFLGDLLVHLERPLEALRAMRSVTAGRLIMTDTFDPTISYRGEPLLRYVGGWDGLKWWEPSLEALAQWVLDAGYDDVEIKGTYQQPTRFGGHPGWHRAIIHATHADHP